MELESAYWALNGIVTATSALMGLFIVAWIFMFEKQIENIGRIKYVGYGILGSDNLDYIMPIFLFISFIVDGFLCVINSISSTLSISSDSITESGKILLSQSGEKIVNGSIAFFEIFCILLVVNVIVICFLAARHKKWENQNERFLKGGS